MDRLQLPDELDVAFYRAEHPDLSGFDETALRQHYDAFGQREGRATSTAAYREHFLPLVPTENTLEIGPFCSPALRGRGVRYFDVLDAAGLIERAAKIGADASGVPTIDYVSPTGDLAAVTETFDAVFSSHCIEHQPDLVRHLQAVATKLNSGGSYYLIVPDRRYCFDYFIANSTIAGIVDAYVEARKVHRLASVIEHRALTTHNDARRHWAGDHVNPGYGASLVPRTRAAIAEYEGAKGGYIDVHAWQFTPWSFRTIARSLWELGLSPMRVARVYGTGGGRNEFTAVLEKPA